MQIYEMSLLGFLAPLFFSNVPTQRSAQSIKHAHDVQKKEALHTQKRSQASKAKQKVGATPRHIH